MCAVKSIDLINEISLTQYICNKAHWFKICQKIVTFVTPYFFAIISFVGMWSHIKTICMKAVNFLITSPCPHTS